PAQSSASLPTPPALPGAERPRGEVLGRLSGEAEEGRARAEVARQQLQHELPRRLLGKTLPEVVVRLLQEAWSKVLLLTCLKHGEESSEGQAGLETMDELIWSVELHDDPQALQRLLELAPGLLKSLRDGVTSAAFDPFATSEYFRQRESLHVQALQRFSRLRDR
ncbi:DUF1631 family protein, partial [Pseudomonas syringae]